MASLRRNYVLVAFAGGDRVVDKEFNAWIYVLKIHYTWSG